MSLAHKYVNLREPQDIKEQVTTKNVLKKGWGQVGELEILLVEIFLLGEGNLKRSDFGHSNLFQS